MQKQMQDRPQCLKHLNRPIYKSETELHAPSIKP